METMRYGTVVQEDDNTYVILDGTEEKVEAFAFVEVKNGDRVSAVVKNHMIVITGNLTSASQRRIEKAGLILGDEAGAHALVDQNALRMFDKYGNAYAIIADDTDENGIGKITESIIISNNVLSPVIVYSHYEPYDTDDVTAAVDGIEAIPERISVTDDGMLAVNVPLGYNHAKGGEVVTITYRSIAVQDKNFTFGYRREGRGTGAMSMAIGYDVVADGVASFAQGQGAEASGRNSRAFGSGVKAMHENETVVGSFNDQTIEGMLFVIGNGYSDSNRSNAFAVDWAGNAIAKNIDQGWIPATITKASAVGTVTNLEAYKHNGLMHVAFTVRATVPAGSWTTIANISGGTKYRPGNDTYTYGGVTSRPIGIRVTTAGAVQVYTSNAITDNILYGSIQYPAAGDIISGGF